MDALLAPLFAVLGGAVLALVSGVLLLTAAFLSAPPSRGTPYVLPNGMRITHWTKDETNFLYAEIFGAASEYARDDKVLFKPGAIIVDAGANIGMFTLFAAARCGGDATIVAFEPIPSTHAVLSANAAAAMRGEFDAVLRPGSDATHAPRLRIETPPYGLSSAPSVATFAHHPHLSIWSTSDEGMAAARLDRMEADMPRAVAASPTWAVRTLIPLSLVRCCTRAVMRGRLGKTVPVTARLVPLSHVIDTLALPVIDLLKVDVEGAELAVLAGVRADQWPLIQQVVAEVETFAEAAEMCSLLESKGLVTERRATERERTPGVHSQVSMVYASRPSYRKANAEQKAGAAGSASPQGAPRRQRAGSEAGSAKSRGGGRAT
jgi:hypothetical protein